MTANRFLTIITLCFTLLSIGPAYAQNDFSYVVTYTNGRNDVGFFRLQVNGTTFKAGPRFFFTSSARIGTTSPQLFGTYRDANVWVHHTFAGPNNEPIYGIAKFDFYTGQLLQLVPFPEFLIQRFDVLNIIEQCCTFLHPRQFPDRTLFSNRNTNDIFSARLNPVTVPGATQFVFNNANDRDVVFGAAISRDGRAAVQGLRKLRGSAFVNQILTRKVLDGGGTGPLNVISSGVAAYSPTISNTRLLAYRIFQNFGKANQQSQILTQRLNNRTLQPIGAAKQITNFARAPRFGRETAHSVALAETGDFMIYTLYNSACKKEIMYIQPLDPNTGNKIGPPKILKGCNSLANIPVGYYGIDLAFVICNNC